MTDKDENTISEMPFVTNEQIEKVKDKEVKEKSILIDAQGNTFDPEKHETNEDGTPRVSSTGKLMKRRGRKAGVNYQDNTRPRSSPNSGQPRTLGPEAAGRSAADAVCLLGVALGGEEWFPEGWQPDLSQGNEHAMIQQAFTQYFKEKGVKEIPVGLGLFMAIAAYAAPRLFLPETKSRMQKAKIWLVNKYYKFKYGKNNARPDLRNDNEWKNDNGETSGETIPKE